MSLLEVEGINVFYGPTQVLWDISLEVGQDEIVAIIGPNGNGKSTFLKTIFGMLKPRSGVIRFDGKRIDGHKPHYIAESGISYVMERKPIFPEMSVRENIEIGAFRAEREQKRANLERVFTLFPILKERQNQLAKTFSGGEMQMLVLARGLMGNPKLLIIDEPFLGLAPKIIDKLVDTIAEINKGGLTILIAEQSASCTFDICNRIYVLEMGRIVLQGDSKNPLIYEHVKEVYLG